MLIIGISGNAGTGKDYITRHYLVPLTNKPYIIASFADHFKLEAIVKEGLDRAKVYGRKDKFTRQRLQQKGTEEGRDIYGENIWIDILHERLLQYEERGIEIAFITDCRFPNEIEYVKSRGKIVRIHAPDRHLNAMRIENGCDVEITSHSSETSVQDYDKWDFVIDNTIENEGNVKRIIQSLNIL